MSADVAVQLETHFADGTARASSFHPDYQRLWASLGDAARGGKRFRPALVTGIHRALGGTQDDVAERVGAAVELLHTAFVIHDDVIDGDDVRRGAPNVSGTFAARAAAAGAPQDRASVYGRTAAILAGDLALVGASRMLALCGADAGTTVRLLDLLDRAVFVSAAGELADVRLSLELDEATLGEIVTVAEHKTAAYSFQLPLQAGAVLAGAPDHVVLGLGRLGQLIGIAFQLLDDLKGVFGAECDTGKSPLGDLREHKLTPLIAYARTTPAWAAIAPDFGDPSLTDERAAVVRRHLTECGARRFVEDLAGSYLSASEVLAAELDLPREFVAWMGAMADDFVRTAA